MSKCAKTIFEHRKMVKGEGLPVLDKQMETTDLDENEIYKILGAEQVDEIKLYSNVLKAK